MTTLARIDQLLARPWQAFFVLLAAALLPALAGQGGQLALDYHEIFVARTAEEMMQRGDWLVPTFNDAARINKPPLPYWLVMAIDRVGGGDGIVSPFEARLPSILAGVAMVLLTWGTGRALLGRRAAFLGALLLAGSAGYVAHTHSARVDMVNAAGIAAALCAAAWAWRFAQMGRTRAARWACAGMVAGLVLAAMAKAFYAPLALIVGLALFAWSDRHHPRPFRPAFALVLGTLTVLVASLWWYALIYFTVPEAWSEWTREIANRTHADEGDPWWKWFDPYYLYQTARWILPWAALYPLALAAPWLKGLRRRRGVRMLWLVTVVGMIAWQVLPGRRAIYMLPILPALCLLMAAAALAIGRQLLQSRHHHAWHHLGVIHIVTIAFVPLAARFALPAGIRPDWITIGLAIVAAVVLLVIWRRGGEWERSPAAVAWVAAIGPVLFAALAAHASLWDVERLRERQFAHAIAPHVRPDDVLIGFKHECYSQQYYLHRTIEVMEDMEQVSQRVREAGEAYVIIRGPRQPPAEFQAGEVVRMDLRDDGEPGDAAHLYRVRPAP